MQSLSVLGFLFAVIGSLVTAFYSFANLIAVVFYELIGYEKLAKFLDFVLGMDVVTWPIYGVITIASFMAVISVNEKSTITKKKHTIWWVSHLVLMLISFICLSIIFDNSF